MAPLSWRDRYREASFRDVPFKVLAQSTEAGRRLAIHEYVNRSLPYAEDLGRRALVFKLDALVLGDDYDIARNALFNAVQEPGPGILVHPAFGRLNVACLRCEVLDEAENQRMARFALEFSEVGEKRYPDSSVDDLSFLDLKADATLKAASDYFSARFNTTGVEQFVKDDAISIFQQAANQAAKVLSFVNQSAANAARSASTIDRFKRESFQLISSPGVAAQRFLSCLQLLNGSRNYKRLASGLKGFYNFGFGRNNPARRSSRSSRKLADNRQALDGFIKKSALAHNSRFAARASLPASSDIDGADGFSSVREAVVFKTEFLGQIDLSLLGDNSDDLYLALQDLRVSTAQAVPGSDSRLQRVRTLTTSKPVCSLVLAHDLYGRAEKEEDILLRNRLTKPAFIPVGSELEVTLE